MWDDLSKLRVATRAITLATLALFVAATIAWLARHPSFEVRQVIVGGSLARVDTARLEATIRSDIAGTFFTTDLVKAKSALAGLPWVREVSIRRRWPRSLEITIEEHQPLARWNERALVNSQGEVFVAPHAAVRCRDSRDRIRRRRWSRAVFAKRHRRSRRSASSRRRSACRREAAGGCGQAVRRVRSTSSSVATIRAPAFNDSRRAIREPSGPRSASGTHIEHVDARYPNGFAARIPALRERPARKPAGAGKAAAERADG